MVPSVLEPPGVLLTNQVTARFVVPVTLAANTKESPARIFAVAGEMATVIEGGGGGGAFVLRVVAEQPAMISITGILPSWSSLRITEDTHRDSLKTEYSLARRKGEGYWTKGQYWANAREMKPCNAAISE